MLQISETNPYYTCLIKLNQFVAEYALVSPPCEMSWLASMA